MLLPAAAAKSLQSCLTLCNPIDGNPPGSPVPGILQARILEWVAISFCCLDIGIFIFQHFYSFNLFFSIFRLFCSTFFKVYPSGLLFLTLHVLMLIPTTEFFISTIFIPVFPLGSFYDFGFFLCIANIFLYLLMSSSGLFQVLYAYISIILPQVVYVVLL